MTCCADAGGGGSSRPSDGRIERIDRIVRAAAHGAKAPLCERTAWRLSVETIARIEALIAVDDDHADDGDGDEPARGDQGGARGP
jgi:hypothetical protein